MGIKILKQQQEVCAMHGNLAAMQTASNVFSVKKIERGHEV
jgi:hypothetical protein